MRNHPLPYLQEYAPYLTSLGRGLLGISLLSFLAIFTWGENNHSVNIDFDASPNGAVGVVDMPLHANSEHSLSPKRFLNRDKSQRNSFGVSELSDLPEPFWILLGDEFSWPQSLSAIRPYKSAVGLPPIGLPQWVTLNISRAPPIV